MLFIVSFFVLLTTIFGQELKMGELGMSTINASYPSVGHCSQMYDIVESLFYDGEDTCLDKSGGERGIKFELETIGIIAKCLFRFHCITRLDGVTDLAKELAEERPPLFDLNTPNVPAELRQEILEGECDDSRVLTINQLFQSTSRCEEQIKPLVPRFCEPSQCYKDKNNITVDHFYCDKTSACNVILNDYGRFCIRAGPRDPDLIEWTKTFKSTYPKLDSCDEKPEDILHSRIGFVVASDGSDFSMQINNINGEQLPDVHDRRGRRCNAGSRNCPCLLPPPEGQFRALSGDGGACAQGLTCIDGWCHNPWDLVARGDKLPPSSGSTSLTVSFAVFAAVASTLL